MKHTEVTKEVWSKILKDCRKLYKNMPEKREGGGLPLYNILQLGTWDGQRPLKALGDKDGINFNGYPDPLDHETFLLRREGSNGFSCCKTARKPYDLMVCACLIVYCFHSRETMDLGSDGDWDDWAPAMTFVEEVLGAQYVMKFKIEQEF
jgi:hypothetical protein